MTACAHGHQVLLSVGGAGGRRTRAANAVNRETQRSHGHAVTLADEATPCTGQGADLSHRCFDAVNAGRNGCTRRQDQISGRNVN